MSLNLHQLALQLELEYHGEADLVIEAAASLASARPGDIGFIQHRRYLPELESSLCSAVIVPLELASEVGDKAYLISDNPQFHFVRAIEALQPPSDVVGGVHASAQISKSARLGERVAVGAQTIIGENVEVGSDCVIGAGCILESGVILGSHSQLHSRVTLRWGVSIGQACIIQSGAVIGGDGFGLVMHEERWHRIPQLGSVVLGDNVEIGANTTVDRGALDDTIIENGCKLDNQIQVAHNVRIGEHTAIAACVGIAGSARIGRNCRISGAAVVLGHLEVVDNVTITAMSLVTKDIKEAGVYSSGTPLMENKHWHRSNARYKSLDKLAATVSRLEKSGK